MSKNKKATVAGKIAIASNKVTKVEIEMVRNSHDLRTSLENGGVAAMALGSYVNGEFVRSQLDEALLRIAAGDLRGAANGAIKVWEARGKKGTLARLVRHSEDVISAGGMFALTSTFEGTLQTVEQFVAHVIKNGRAVVLSWKGGKHIAANETQGFLLHEAGKFYGVFAYVGSNGRVWFKDYEARSLGARNAHEIAVVVGDADANKVAVALRKAAVATK